MVIADAEAESTQIQAQGTRGNETTIQPGTNGNGGSGFGRTSHETGNQSISNDRNDRAGGNSTNQRGQTVTGGILDRLISSVVEEITELEIRTADRKEYLKELESLSEQLSKTPAQSK